MTSMSANEIGLLARIAGTNSAEAEYVTDTTNQLAADLDAVNPVGPIPYFPPRETDDRSRARLAASGAFAQTVIEARSAQYLRAVTRQVVFAPIDVSDYDIDGGMSNHFLPIRDRKEDYILDKPLRSRGGFMITRDKPRELLTIIPPQSEQNKYDTTAPVDRPDTFPTY